MYVTTVETWGDNDFILIISRAREWLNDVDYHQIMFLLFLIVFLSGLIHVYNKRILVPATAFYSFMIKKTYG
jgi:hypothetical protein